MRTIAHHLAALGWLWVLLFATIAMVALGSATIAIAKGRRRVAFTGLLVSGSVTLASLVATMAATGLGIASAYATTGSTLDPSQKARVLAEGISAAMNAAAIGLTTTFIAGSATIACLVAFLTYRSRPEPRAELAPAARV